MRFPLRMTLMLAIVLWPVVGTTALADDAVPLIADPDFGEWDPAWSTDGTKIAFDSDRSGNQDIWIYDTVTEDIVQLTTDEATDGWACWSPDDEWIVFESNRQGTFDLYKIPSGGGEAVPLVPGHGRGGTGPRGRPRAPRGRCGRDGGVAQRRSGHAMFCRRAASQHGQSWKTCARVLFSAPQSPR